MDLFAWSANVSQLFLKKKKNQIPECNKFILDPSGCFIYHIRKFAKFSLS